MIVTVSYILIHAATLIDLENIMLSEIHQTQKDKYYRIPLRACTQNRSIHRGRKWNKDYQELGVGQRGELVLMGTEFMLGMMKQFVVHIVVMSSQHCECIKCH